MVEIIPAILPKSFSDLEGKLALIREHAPVVQVDVVDGIFAPTKTWPYAGGEMFSAIAAQEEGLPFWEDFDFQFDLMISHTAKEAGDYITAGASSLVVHGAGDDARAALESLQKDRQGEWGIKVGLALLPGDTAATFAQYRELCDFVQVMGIARVGVQGSAFDERALGLITSLRQDNPQLTIQVDGGVKLENAQALARAGANRLVVGSAIFGSAEPLVALKEIRRRANS
jgi:ribulose-phosphate 3-epimerase